MVLTSQIQCGQAVIPSFMSLSVLASLVVGSCGCVGPIYIRAGDV